jgi:hypothetical protein
MVSAVPVDKMPTKVDKLSREDFEDASPRVKRSRSSKPAKRKSRDVSGRKARVAAGRADKLLKLQPVVEDEVVTDDSGSEAEVPTGRPQRECKSRTSTLVAISLAEQDYEQFDLDFERFKSDVNSISDVDLARMRHATKRVLVDRKNVPVELSEEEDEKVPTDEINLVNGRSVSLGGGGRPKSKSSSTEGKRRSNKTDRKRIVLTKLPKAKRKQRDRSSKTRASTKTALLLLKDDIKSEEDVEEAGVEEATKENAVHRELGVRARARGGREAESLQGGMKGAVRERAGQVVAELLEPPPAFLCLACSAHFTDYSALQSHRVKCRPSGGRQAIVSGRDPKDPSSVQKKKQKSSEPIHQYLVKKDAVLDDVSNAELYEYVTGELPACIKALS